MAVLAAQHNKKAPHDGALWLRQEGNERAVTYRLLTITLTGLQGHLAGRKGDDVVRHHLLHRRFQRHWKSRHR